MKVTLQKDVLTPNNGVGRAGQTVEMSSDLGKQYIAKGFAVEAEPDAEALPAETKPAPPKPLTRETVKEDKEAKTRNTKPDGPDATK